VEIFLSHARPDRSRVNAVAQRLRQAGNNVWLDTGYSSGEAWWGEILRQLRLCDAAVVVVSRASLRSQACIRERQYAASLGKPVLPLAIEPFNPDLLPFELARLQIIDYSRPDEAAAFQLAGAIMRLPEARALPDPLPEPPLAPPSPLEKIAEQLRAPSLDQDQQLAIIGRLEGALAPSADENDRDLALDMLGQMEKREDLFAAVDRRIAVLRSSVRPAEAPRTPPWTQPPPAPPRGQWTQGAGTGQRAPAGQQAPAGQATWGGQGATSGPGPQSGTGVQTGQPTAVGREPAPDAVPNPHWAMAIASLIFFFPLGIPAVILAQRTRASLRTRDLATAQKSAKVVKILFWIVVAIYVLVALSRA
jgi:TIR domain/Interferon-induced transmembrane protein